MTDPSRAASSEVEPTGFDPDATHDRMRRSVIVAGFWLSAAGLSAIATYQWSDGEVGVASAFYGVAVLALLVRGLLKRTGSIALAGHIIAALVAALFLGLAAATAAQASGTLFALALVPLLVTLIAGHRAGALWTIGIVLLIFALGRYLGPSPEPHLALDPAHLQRGKFLTSVLLVLGVYGLARSYERTRLRAFAAAEDATRRAVASEAALRRTNERLERQAHIDPLTGVSNRRGLERGLVRLARDRARASAPACVVMIDLDDFKAVNERFGHAAGDSVLAHVAATARGSLRPGDLLSRVGGDEFIVLLPGCELAEAQALAERLRANLASAPASMDGSPLPVTVSLGVAALAPDATTTDELLVATRQALRLGKRLGKDRVIVARPDASVEVEQRRPSA